MKTEILFPSRGDVKFFVAADIPKSSLDGAVVTVINHNELCLVIDEKIRVELVAQLKELPFDLRHGADLYFGCRVVAPGPPLAISYERR